MGDISAERCNRCLGAISKGGDVGKLYDEWSSDYDVDNSTFKQKDFESVFLTVSKYYPHNKDIALLDVGAGTGVGGRKLRKLGYINIDAVDPSGEMLRVAQEDNTYTRTYIHFVGDCPLQIPDNTYDCVFAIGVIAHNHFPACGLLDICRIMKPGGHFIMQGNLSRWNELPEYHVTMASLLDKMEAEKKWEKIEWRTMNSYLKIGETQQKGLLFVYRKL